MELVPITNAQVLEIVQQLPHLNEFSLCTFEGAGFSTKASEVGFKNIGAFCKTRVYLPV